MVPPLINPSFVLALIVEKPFVDFPQGGSIAPTSKVLVRFLNSLVILSEKANNL